VKPLKIWPGYVLSGLAVVAGLLSAALFVHRQMWWSAGIQAFISLLSTFVMGLSLGRQQALNHFGAIIERLIESQELAAIVEEFKGKGMDSWVKRA
jgi:hypothetical protein